MRIIKSWTLKAIGAFIIVTYCQGLNQDIGEKCTNKNGIVGFCQSKTNCSEDSNLGVVCNSEQTIICCAKNTLKNIENMTSSDSFQEDQLIQSRFSFIPDFFHASLIPKNPTSNINFFNHQNNKNPNTVGNVFHQSLNTMKFVEDRPYQNFEQDVTTKPNKKKNSLTRQTNSYELYSSNNNNQNSNIQNIFNSDETTKISQTNYHYSSHETQKLNFNQNNNNHKQPNYETYPQNQNNYYYLSSTTPKPNYNQNNNNKRPNYLTNPQNQNNNYNPSSTTIRPNYNLNNINNKQPNYETYSQYQNNNYNPSSTTIRPNLNQNNNNNYRPTSSNIFFPDDSDDSTTENSYTKFTTTKKNDYEYQNKPYEYTKRISEIKCEEYSKALTTTISVLPLSIDAATKPVSIETCDSTGVGLIVGGSKAELGEFPHMAAIEFHTTIGNQWNCGGTLISEQFVLTAAHCTISSQGNPVRVRLGELNLQNSFDGANPVDVVISEIIVHPDYVSSLRYNDIALLRLEKKVKFNNHIRPACLHNKENIYSSKVTATGWGSIAFGDHSSDELLKVSLDVIDNRQCNKLYEDQKKILNRGIIGSMLCAGDLAGGHDTCLVSTIIL